MDGRIHHRTRSRSGVGVNPLVAVGIAVGILAGAWTWASSNLGLTTWVAFVTWALFFAAGGKLTGLVKVAPAVLTGLLYGSVVLSVAGLIPSAWTVPIGVALIAFIMCAQANWSVLSFIPAAFAGAALLFGTGGDWLGAGISALIGVGLGFVSEWSGGLLAKLGKPARAPFKTTTATAS